MDTVEIEAAKAVIALQDAGAVLKIELDPITAFTIIGQLQLALRHPANDGVSSGHSRDVIDRLAEMLPPAIRPIIERGYDPSYDVAVRRCRVCGCTDERACEGGCYWVEDDICSECVSADDTERAWASAEAGAVLNSRSIALGIERSALTNGWVVWASLYGSDVSGLSGWSTEAQAQAAWQRYRTLAWDEELLPAIEADRSAEGYIDPVGFTGEELESIAAALHAVSAGAGDNGA